MKTLIYVLMFIVLSCIGSFIGLCADRIPRGEQIWKGRSHCDSCGKKLGFFELIPIVSYLVLRGRCVRCHKSIPFTSTCIELITAIMGTVCLLSYGIAPNGFIYSTITCILIEIAVLDYETMEISDIAVLLIALCGIVLMIQNDTYLSSLIGLFCVSVPFLLLALFGLMGYGDVKLMAAVGLLLGYRGVLLAGFFGIVVGSLAAIPLKLTNKKGWKSEIAFGPFLCIGTYISMLFGERMLSMYLALLQ